MGTDSFSRSNRHWEPYLSLLDTAYDTKFKNMPVSERLAVLEHVKQQYWMRGRLRYMCYPGGQTELYDRVHAQPKLHPGTAEPVVALCHRRFGKSHLSALLCVERCLAQPGAEVHFGTDTKKHARQILEEKLFKTFKDMPRFISYRTRDNRYWFRNKYWPKGVESVLVLEGFDYNLGGGMRGDSADLVVADEVREVRHLEYVMKRVIVPMFRGRPNPTVVLCTTPPDSMDHDFVRVYVKRARESNSLITIPASKNINWTEDDTKLMLKEYETKENLGWRREIECELIADSSKMIVPEWPMVQHECLIEAHPRPAYYAPYVALDMGWKDHSAAVFAYYDFNRNKVVIVDELFVNYTPTEDFADMLVDKIKQQFPEHTWEHLSLIADGNALNIADLNRAVDKISDFYVREVDKYDRDAGINNMRSGIQAGKVIVEEANCKQLDNQLLNGGWNEKRTDFARSGTLGHCDLIACLVYLYKKIRWGENVSPAGETGWMEGVCRSPELPKNPDMIDGVAGVEALKAMFGNKRFIQRRKQF